MSTEDLVAAIEAGDGAAVERTLAAEPDLAETTNGEGVPLLLLALYHRQTQIAEQIAARKAKLSVHEATALGRPEVVSALLDAGAPIEKRSSDGFTPLQYAAFFGCSSVVELLLERGADSNAVAENSMKVQPLHSAATIGSVEICRRLLEAGADVNGRQQLGYTPLMSAALHGNDLLVRLLLDHGADRSTVAEDGKTARDLALEGDHSALAETLAPR